MDIGRDKQHDASFPVLIKLWLTFSACIASISSQAAERDLEQDMAALQTRAIASACHNELNTYCPNQPDELGCLNSLINMQAGEARIAVPSPFKFKVFTLAAGEFSTDENLTIRSASLDKNTKHYNVLLSAYPAKVHFSETGQLIQGTLVEESVIDGIPYSTVFPISFSTEGKVQRGMLAKVTTIHGRIYQANRVISFSAGGTVTEGVLAEDTLIGNVLIPADSTIKVQPNREITISSGETISIDGNEYSGRSLTMTEAGGLLQAKLAQDAIINDEYFEADTKLVFNENGDLVYRLPPSQMDKLRAVSGPTLLVGPEKVVDKHMSSQECEYFIESSKQRKGFWLHGPAGYSLGGSYFKDCIDKTIGLID